MKYKLQDLIDIEHFQHLQDRLNEIYSFPSSIIDIDGNILTATAWQDVCTKFHRKNKECERECIKSDQYILEHLHEANPAVSYRCPHGLVDNATPIIIDGIHYGNFFTGQFFLEKPDLDFFIAQAKKYGFNEEAYIEAVKKVPIWTQKQLDNYLFFIKGLIAVISESGLKALKEIENRKEIQESEERYRSILKAAMDGYWRTDTNGRLLEVNDAYCKMSGYSENELLAMHIPDLEYLENSELVAEHMQKVITKGFDRFETKHRRKDGNALDVEVSIQYRPEEGGQCVCFLRDITERKQAFEAVKTVNDRMQLAADSARFGIWDLDLKENRLEWDDWMFRIYGINRDNFGNAPEVWQTSVHPDDLERSSKEIEQALKGETGFDTEFRVIRPDGEIRYLKAHATISRDSNGEPIKMTGINYDITDRKHIEDKLKNERDLFEKLMGTSPAGIVFVNAEGDVTYANRRAEEILGIQLSENPDRTYDDPEWKITDFDGESFPHENIPFSVVQKTKRPVFGIRHAIEWPDGRRIFLSINATPIYGSPDAFEGMVAAVEDITEQYSAQEALRKSEEMYRLISDATTDYAYLATLTADGSIHIEWAGGAFQKITGYTVDEVNALENTWYSVIYPEDLKKITEDPNLPNKTRASSWETEYRIITRHGLRWISDRVMRVSEHSAEDSIQLIGGVQDITERKRAEDALRESEEKFRIIFDSSNDGILLGDAVTKELVTANNKICEILGYTKEELTGLSVKDIHPQGELGQVLDEFEKQLRKEVRISENLPVKRKDGTVFYADISSSPVTIDGKDYLLGNFRDITERKQAEEKIEAQNRLMSTLLDNLQVGVFMVDAPSGKPLLANKQATKLLGRGIIQDAEKSSLAEVYQAFKIGTHEPYPENKMPIIRGLKGETHTIDDMVVVQPGGKQVQLHIQGTPVIDLKGNITASLVNFFDITEQKKAEQERISLQNQLAQAQKMESVGRLAGGVAHDFNNMLGVILGNADMALEEADPDKPLYENLIEIKSAAKRSVNVTRQLLAFARKQTIAPKVIDLNGAIENILKMLRRLIGEDIDLSWFPGKKLWQVKMDPSQLDQILANLSVNARDAITGEGKLTIETGNVTLDKTYCENHPGFSIGDFVQLTASDNGCGMDKEILKNLFEPFYTTKDLDKGTGLGLATVYGIVKQNEGYINVYSEPGKGTSFKIYLPRHKAAGEKVYTKDKAGKVLHGSESILIVEDELSILKMTEIMLKRLGYTVLTANTPGEAIGLAREYNSEIHLLLTDVIMPEMNGQKLFKNLLSIYPNLKSLFMSGYTANVIARHGVLDEGIHYIQKPFSRQELSIKLREVLDDVGEIEGAI